MTYADGFTGSEQFWLVLVLLLSPYLLGSTYMVWQRRDTFPIKQRWPALVCLAQLMLFLSSTSFAFTRIMYDDYPCAIDQLFAHGGIGTTNILYLVRVWKLWFDFKATAEAAHGRKLSTLDGSDGGRSKSFNMVKEGWFLNHRYLRGEKFLKGVAMTVSFLHFLPAIILIASNDKVRSGAMPTGCTTDSNPALAGYETLLVAVLLIYGILFSVLAFYLRREEDELYLKKELRVLGWTVFVTMVIWFLLVTVLNDWQNDLSFSALSTFCLYMALPIINAGSVLYPLAISFKTEKQLAESQRQTKIEGLQVPNLSLEEFLALDGGPKAFLNFVKKEFSHENMMFWEDVNRFKARWDQLNEQRPDRISRLAFRIYSSYLEPDAALLVNISAEMFDRVRTLFSEFPPPVIEGESDIKTQELPEISREVFTEAQQECFKLMEKDTYQRFMKKPFYKDVVAKSDNVL